MSDPKFRIVFRFSDVVMAKRFWPGEDPVGKRISTANISGQEQWRMIAGVVGSVRHLGMEIEPRPEICYHIRCD